MAVGNLIPMELHGRNNAPRHRPILLQLQQQAVRAGWGREAERSDAEQILLPPAT